MSSIATFRYDFHKIKRGTTFSFEFLWGDANGNALDLSQCSVECAIYDKKKTELILELGLTVIQISPGKTRHFLTKEQTATLEGSYNYELVVTAGEVRYCYMDGLMPFVDWT